MHLARLPSQTVNNCRGIVNFLPGILIEILFVDRNSESDKKLDDLTLTLPSIFYDGPI